MRDPHTRSNRQKRRVCVSRGARPETHTHARPSLEGVRVCGCLGGVRSSLETPDTGCCFGRHPGRVPLHREGVRGAAENERTAPSVLGTQIPSVPTVPCVGAGGRIDLDVVVAVFRIAK